MQINFLPRPQQYVVSGFDINHYPQQIEQISIFSHDKKQKLLSS